MDFNRVIARVKAILMTPKTEWPVIAAEPATVSDLYTNYILILAALPAIAGFIKGSLVGYGAFGIHVRVPIGTGLFSAIIGYVLSLVLVYVMALIVNALAPTFGGQQSQVQALKAVAYSYTASWIAGIGLILPGIGWLIAIAGGIYGIYLLYLGLPPTMKAPVEKAGGYTAVSVIVAIILGWIIAIIVAGIAGTGAMMGAAMSGAAMDRSGSDVTIDKDSSLGKLDAWSKKMQAAGKQMDAAQKSGDGNAQANALGAMVGAATGSGQVEALAPEALKPFVPESLDGLKRTEFSVERNGAMGVEVTQASATYSDGANRSLQLELTDMASMKGMLEMAGWAAAKKDKVTDHGYDKTYKQGDSLVHEQWDSRDKRGEYSVIVGQRFSLKVSGNANSIDELKSAVANLNLAGLEAMKDQGVKKG